VLLPQATGDLGHFSSGQGRAPGSNALVVSGQRLEELCRRAQPVLRQFLDGTM
jgi:hypothetical protein